MTRFVKFLCLSALMAAAMAGVSCSSDAERSVGEKLDAVATDESVYIAVGDIDRLLEQLDVTVKDGRLELPPYLQSLANMFAVSRMDRAAIDGVTERASGVNYGNAVFAVTPRGSGFAAMLAFGVDNAKDLDETLKSVGLHADEVAVRDGMGYVVFADRELKRGDAILAVVDEVRAAAESAPLASWKRDYLSEPTVFAQLSMPEKAMELIGVRAGGTINLPSLINECEYVGLRFDLDGQTAKTAIRNYDASGKALELKYAGKADTALLDYAYPDDFVALMLCMDHEGYVELGDKLRRFGAEILGETGAFANTRTMTALDDMTRIPAEFLNDGGVFAMGGFAPGVSLTKTDFESPAAYHVVIAADIKPEKTEEAFAAVTSLLEEVFDTRATGRNEGAMRLRELTARVADHYDYRTNDWVSETMNVVVALDGNTLIISNAPVKKEGSKVLRKDLFAGSMAAGQIVVDKSTPLYSELGYDLGFDCFGVARGDETVFTVEVSGTDKKIIPAIAGMF